MANKVRIKLFRKMLRTNSQMQSLEDSVNEYLDGYNQNEIEGVHCATGTFSFQRYSLGMVLVVHREIE